MNGFLTPHDYSTLRALVVAAGAESAALYGSRACAEGRRASDLDLAVTGLDAHGLARLREALEESPLPYRCDVLDAATLPDGPLRQTLLREAVPVWGDLAEAVEKTRLGI